MPAHPYRNQARQALKRAQELLAGDQLRYAALELRLAIEALTYDRAQAYMKELPLEALSRWQPKQLMDALLEIDPTAGETYTVGVGSEPAPGVAPETMHTLGTEVAFGLAQIKKHYHLVGSLLHTPTMQQLSQGIGWDPHKARKRGEDTAHQIEVSLNSPVWNFTLGVFSDFRCLRCDQPIHKRVPHGQTQLVANCIYCNAPHAGHRREDGKIHWSPMMTRASCPTPNCPEPVELWDDEIKPGTHWTCKGCNKHYRVQHGIGPG